MELAAASPWLSNTDWKPEEVRFTAPDSGLVRLTLICQRVQGATRIEGSLELRRLALVAHALAGVPFGPGELQFAVLSAEAGSGTLKRAPRGRP
jgi:hypothetical protein